MPFASIAAHGYGAALGRTFAELLAPRVFPQDTVNSVNRVSPSRARAFSPRTPFQVFHPPRREAALGQCEHWDHSRPAAGHASLTNGTTA